MARGSKSNNKGRGSGRGADNRGRSGAGRSRRPPTNRQFPRTARLNSLLHEIVADFFERVDDERFDLITIVGVEVDNDLNRARVFISDPDLVPTASSSTEVADSTSVDSPSDPEPSGDEYVLAALREYRKAIQSKIGRETRMRKTPEVVFEIDPGIRSGARIDAILSNLDVAESDTANDGDDAEANAVETNAVEGED